MASGVLQIAPVLNPEAQFSSDPTAQPYKESPLGSGRAPAEFEIQSCNFLPSLAAFLMLIRSPEKYPHSLEPTAVWNTFREGTHSEGHVCLAGMSTLHSASPGPCLPDNSSFLTD